ncbi:MAG: glycosyltransferase [Nitrososphaera sp.]|jgi:UDP-N-acetylglucosamine--N-acetylmuramyl-(pentapeptide) pyrophosphoryl-undecaprenol N-acetylglucosamine transferase
MPSSLLFFASPIGLGHATRDIAIAERLAAPKSDVLFVSGAGAPRLIEKRGFRCLDLYRPEKFRVENGQLQQSFQWLMAYYSYYKKCKAISKDILAKQHGRLVVSDEDFASIAVAEEMGRKRVLITDIAESHFTKGAASLIEKRMNAAMKKMMAKCDCVIMPDAGDDYGNVVHVGPIVRAASADRDTLRRRFNFTKKTIVVSIGGTDAGKYLIEKTVEAYRKLQPRLDAELVVVPGPALQLPDSDDYRNMGFVENLHEIIFAADLVVSLAGRSTMDESIAYGTPGIFIPIKGHFEQEEGAKRLGYRYDDLFRLESLIEEKIGRRTAGADASGAQKAARIISDLAGG